MSGVDPGSRRQVGNSTNLLKTICRSNFDTDVDVQGDVPAGVAGTTGYFLADDWLTIGHGLAWSASKNLSKLQLLTSDEGKAASSQRVAEALTGPNLEVEVGLVRGGQVKSVSSVGRPKESPSKPFLVDKSLELLNTTNVARVLTQHSVKCGTYESISAAGLEIARVIDYESTAVVEVGVGQADREIHALTSQGSAEEILRRVASRVLETRHASRDQYHPLAKVDPAGYIRFLAGNDEKLLNLGSLELLSNLVSDDVFNDSPRAAMADDESTLIVFLAGSSPVFYEHLVGYLDTSSAKGVERIVVVCPERDITYLQLEPLGGLGKPIVKVALT